MLRISSTYLSRIMRKSASCICENKGADQLRCNCGADQCLCFCYKENIVPLLSKSQNPKFQASSHLLWLYSLVCVRTVRKRTGFLMTQLIYQMICLCTSFSKHFYCSMENIQVDNQNMIVVIYDLSLHPILCHFMMCTSC